MSWVCIRLKGEALTTAVFMIHSEMTDVSHGATACPLRSGRSLITFAARSVLSWWGSRASHPVESLTIGKTSRSTYRSEHFLPFLGPFLCSLFTVWSPENCTFGRTGRSLKNIMNTSLVLSKFYTLAPLCCCIYSHNNVKTKEKHTAKNNKYWQIKLLNIFKPKTNTPHWLCSTTWYWAFPLY